MTKLMGVAEQQALTKTRIAEMKARGVKRISVRCCRTPWDQCDAALANDGRIIPIDEAPPVPRPGCDHYCRCTVFEER